MPAKAAPSRARAAAPVSSPGHGHDHGRGAASPEEKLAWARQACRAAGLRRTPAREKVLAFLSRQERPVTLATLGAERTLAQSCDPATLFRILQKLEESGVVRRLWLHERVPFYVLLVPHDHHDYVLCTDCGKVEETPLDCPVRSLEKVVEARLGYAGIRHELGFYGVCPDCQTGKPERKAARKPVRG